MCLSCRLLSRFEMCFQFLFLRLLGELSSLLKVQVLNFVCFSQTHEQVRRIKEALAALAIAVVRRGPLCRGHAPASGQLTSLVFLPRVKFTE